MYELATRLPNAAVTVITTAAPEAVSDREAAVRIVRLTSSRLGQGPWLVHLAIVTCFRCLWQRPDVIVCGHVHTVAAALAPGLILRIPVVTFAYAWEIRRRFRGAVSFLLRRADLVLAISRFTERAVVNQGVSPARIRLVHPGVAVERFANAPNRRAAAGRPHRTMLTVSRLNERYKGHDVVIRALPLVRAKCGDVRYVIAGEGRLRLFLSKLASSLGVSDAVQFVGELSDPAIVELIHSCDVLVQMSRETSDGGAEGFGIVCLEAGAASKPVVAGRSGGLPDAVAHDLSGLLVDPDNLGEIADAIVSVLSNPSLAERLGRAGRIRAQEAFTWDLMNQNMRRLLGEVAGKPWQEACASSA